MDIFPFSLSFHEFHDIVGCVRSYPQGFRRAFPVVRRRSTMMSITAHRSCRFIHLYTLRKARGGYVTRLIRLSFPPPSVHFEQKNARLSGQFPVRTITDIVSIVHNTEKYCKRKRKIAAKYRSVPQKVYNFVIFPPIYNAAVFQIFLPGDYFPFHLPSNSFIPYLLVPLCLPASQRSSRPVAPVAGVSVSAARDSLPLWSNNGG